VSRREFWELLARLKSGGLTIVVSTPYMDEANRCDRVALIQRGQILAIDTPSAVIASFDRPLLAVRARDRYQALLALRSYPNTNSVFPFGEVLHFTDRRTGPSAAHIAADAHAYLEGKGMRDVIVEQTEPTIEDSFMARMGAPEGEAAA
jgi:ABC-type multidrug transport system ATPase subunit